MVANIIHHRNTLALPGGISFFVLIMMDNNKIDKEGKYHFVYKTTNLINGKWYIGKHSTYNLNDGYLGSSQHLKYAIKKYGRENFIREILAFCDNEQEAYEKEAEIVTMEVVNDPNSYNKMPGGEGGQKRYTDEELKEHQLKWREDNPEYHREHYKSNREHMREQQREYYKANREQMLEYQREYRQANKERAREYRKANRERAREYHQEYYQANKKSMREYQREYYQANKKSMREQQREYRKANREKINAKRRAKYAANKK